MRRERDKPNKLLNSMRYKPLEEQPVFLYRADDPLKDSTPEAFEYCRPKLSERYLTSFEELITK